MTTLKTQNHHHRKWTVIIYSLFYFLIFTIMNYSTVVLSKKNAATTAHYNYEKSKIHRMEILTTKPSSKLPSALMNTGNAIPVPTFRPQSNADTESNHAVSELTSDSDASASNAKISSIEILAKKRIGNSWKQFIELAISQDDCVLADFVLSVCAESKEAEIASSTSTSSSYISNEDRGHIEQWLASSLLGKFSSGKGMGGEKLLMMKIRDSIPQLKELKDKEITLGYRPRGSNAQIQDLAINAASNKKSS